MSTKFDVAMNNIVASHKSIAEVGSGAEKTIEVQTEITKTYIERLKVMEELMAKYQKKVNGTDWKVTNEKGEKMTLEEAKQYQADLKATRLALENALYLKYTGTEKVIGARDTLSYNGTKEGAKLIEKKHKAQGDHVMKPDESGRIVVHLKTEKTIEYLPDSQVSSEGLQTSLLKETSLSGTLRQISKNIMGVDQNKISTLKQQFSDGKWVELREGEMYFGEKVINGQKQTLFFLVEEKLNIANEAWLSEQNSPGTGLGIIRSSLRSPEAVEGYTDYVENKWKSMDESSKVKEFWKLEQKGKSEGKHLNGILEEKGKSVIENREALQKYVTDEFELSLVESLNKFLVSDFKFKIAEAESILSVLQTEEGGANLAQRLVTKKYNDIPGFKDLISTLKQKNNLNVAKVTQALNKADELIDIGYKNIFFERTTQQYGYDADIGAMDTENGLEPIVIQLKYVTSINQIFKNIAKGVIQLKDAPHNAGKIIELDIINMTYEEFVASERERAIVNNRRNGDYPEDIKIIMKFKDGKIIAY